MTTKKQFSWTWLLMFLFGGGLAGGGAGWIWSDATESADQTHIKAIQGDHTLWLKRHDLEIKELQIVDAARDRDMKYITRSLEEIKTALRDLKKDMAK